MTERAAKAELTISEYVRRKVLCEHDKVSKKRGV